VNGYTDEVLGDRNDVSRAIWIDIGSQERIGLIRRQLRLEVSDTASADEEEVDDDRIRIVRVGDVDLGVPRSNVGSRRLVMGINQEEPAFWSLASEDWGKVVPGSAARAAIDIMATANTAIR